MEGLNSRNKNIKAGWSPEQRSYERKSLKMLPNYCKTPDKPFNNF